MKKYSAVKIIVLIFVVYTSYGQSDTMNLLKYKEPINYNYKNSIGIRIPEGITYKHYYRYLTLEANFGLWPSKSGNLGIFFGQLMIGCQFNRRSLWQPYIGLGFSIGYPIIPNNINFPIGSFDFNGRTGMEFFIKRSGRFSVYADVTYNAILYNYLAKDFPFMLSVGGRFLFSKVNRKE